MENSVTETVVPEISPVPQTASESTQLVSAGSVQKEIAERDLEAQVQELYTKYLEIPALGDDDSIRIAEAAAERERELKSDEKEEEGVSLYGIAVEDRLAEELLHTVGYEVASSPDTYIRGSPSLESSMGLFKTKWCPFKTGGTWFFNKMVTFDKDPKTGEYESMRPNPIYALTTDEEEIRKTSPQKGVVCHPLFSSFVRSVDYYNTGFSMWTEYEFILHHRLLIDVPTLRAMNGKYVYPILLDTDVTKDAIHAFIATETPIDTNHPQTSPDLKAMVETQLIIIGKPIHMKLDAQLATIEKTIADELSPPPPFHPPTRRAIPKKAILDRQKTREEMLKRRGTSTTKTTIA